LTGEQAPAGPGGPSSELVEVVDESGNVVDVVTRQAIRAGNLRHRCTYVAVVTSRAELIVHQRAAWKDVWSGYWDVCFGGVAAVGEAWDLSARRELAEEAGVTGQPLADLGPVSYDQADCRIVGRVYLARYDGPLSCPDGEVVDVDRVPLAELDAWLEGRQVCPDSRSAALPVVRAHLAV
jgi:8-oxo-dGTP pyrophosphatase MutT (NUDIX family)